MRPHGEVRSAIVAAVRERGPMALREIAHTAQIGYVATKWTLGRCVEAGQLVVAGQERREYSKNWVRLYDVPEPVEGDSADDAASTHDGGLMVLSAALASWR